jgi:hypothetical protein
VDTTACYDILSLGLKVVDSTNEMTLFPNPTKGSITLSLTQGFSDAVIKLLDISGQELLTQSRISGKEFNLNLSDFKIGVYFLELHQGSNIKHFKIVKE